MLGTDYPFPLGELRPGALIESMEEFDDTLKVTNIYVSFFKLYTDLCQSKNFNLHYREGTKVTKHLKESLLLQYPSISNINYGVYSSFAG